MIIPWKFLKLVWMEIFSGGHTWSGRDLTLHEKPARDKVAYFTWASFEEEMNIFQTIRSELSECWILSAKVSRKAGQVENFDIYTREPLPMGKALFIKIGCFV